MADRSSSAMFLSLRPEFAQAILDGTKTAEVRRVRPKARPGMLALLYAASPVREVVGTCRIADVVRGAAEDLWRDYGAGTAISEQRFLDYLAGAAAPAVLLLDSPAVLTRPVPLTSLRTEWDNFRPPQSYRFVPEAMLHQLAGLP